MDRLPLILNRSILAEGLENKTIDPAIFGRTDPELRPAPSLFRSTKLPAIGGSTRLGSRPSGWAAVWHGRCTCRWCILRGPVPGAGPIDTLIDVKGQNLWGGGRVSRKLRTNGPVVAVGPGAQGARGLEPGQKWRL